MAKEKHFERLQEDIRKYTELKDGHLQAIERMKGTIENTEQSIEDMSHDGNVWKDRYLQQAAENQKLEMQLEKMQRKLTKLQNQQDDDFQETEVMDEYDVMSDVSLRQLLKRLEKENTELEWQIKEHAWRLDQASTAVCRAEEEKAAILTQLGQPTVNTHQGAAAKRQKEKNTKILNSNDP